MNMLASIREGVSLLWNPRTSGGALTLRQNFAWTFVGNTVFAAAQWAMLIVLAKVGSTEVVGLFALGLAVTAPIMIFANLKLRAVLATDARNEYQFGYYLALRLVTVGLALLVIAGIGLMAGYPRETALVIFLVGLAKAFDALSDILYGYLQQQERMDRIAISRMFQGGMQLISLAVVMVATGNLVLATLAWAMASGLITFVWDVPSVRQVHRTIHKQSDAGGTQNGESKERLAPKWDWPMLWKLMLVTLPLGLAVMLGSLWSNIPRYFIEGNWGASELGIFAAIASLMMVGITIVGALGQSVSPRLAKFHATRRYVDFDRLVRRLVILGFLLGLAGLVVTIVAGRPILSLLYTPEYAARTDVLFWLMIAYTLRFSYVFLGTGIQAMRNFKIHMPIQLVSLGLVLALSYLLIRNYGPLGAAWAMLGANLFEMAAYIVGFLYVRRDERQRSAICRAVG